ncbi:MAG: tetratricopeptide repeat protein [Myxococcaceae bacterium]
MTAAFLAIALLAASPAPVPLEPEIDSQTREDDELPPSSYIPYTPHFGGKKIAGASCLQADAPATVRTTLDQAQLLTQSKDAAQLDKAVAKLKHVVAVEPRTGWAYLTLGSAYAKLGHAAEGARAYETYLLSCRKAPNTDRVQRILMDYWLKTGAKTP